MKVSFVRQLGEQLIKDIRNKKVSLKNPPTYLKKSIHNDFEDDIFTGKRAEKYPELNKKFNANLNEFSFLKSNKLLQTSQDILKGKLTDIKLDIFTENLNKYLRTWQETERVTAKLNYINAVDWHEFDTDDYVEFLQFSAVIDPNTTQQCKECNGIIAKKIDKIWDTISPALHENCRSLLIPVPHEDYKSRTYKGINLENRVKKANELTAPQFKENVARQGLAFDITKSAYYENK